MTRVTALQRRGPNPTFLLAVLVAMVQQISIVPDAHTETAEVFSTRLLVTQHGIKTIAITRGLRTRRGSVASSYALCKIVKYPLSAANRGLSRLQFNPQDSPIATWFFYDRLLRLQVFLNQSQILRFGIQLFL